MDVANADEQADEQERDLFERKRFTIVLVTVSALTAPLPSPPRRTSRHPLPIPSEERNHSGLRLGKFLTSLIT